MTFKKLINFFILLFCFYFITANNLLTQQNIINTGEPSLVSNQNNNALTNELPSSEPSSQQQTNAVIEPAQLIPELPAAREEKKTEKPQAKTPKQKAKSSKKNENRKMINWGFFFMQPSDTFKDKFSEAETGGKPYYHLPFNSWNDPFYLYFNFDWPLSAFLNTRTGWSIGLNFAGSGDDIDSIPVEAETDLGNAHEGAFWAIYNSYNIPLIIYIRIEPVQFWIFKLYTGLGAGITTGIYTYNELAEEGRSSFEEQFEKSDFRIRPIGQIFIGIDFEIGDFFEPMFFELKYTLAEDPVIVNDYLEPEERRVSFQVSGLALGFGFRF